jgi:hypothetical protein
LRLRYLFAAIAAVCTTPFFLFWTWSAIEGARLDRALDALAARDEPLDIAEFDPKPVTADQKQASHYYAQAQKLVEDVLPPAFAQATGRTIERLCDRPPAADRERAIADLKSVESRYLRALELLDQAASLDAAGWDPADRLGTPAEFVGPERLAAVNAVRIARMACGDDGAHASGALLATLRLARMRSVTAARQLPTHHALESILEFTSPPPSMLEALQREYERQADEHAVEKSLRYSRARYLKYTTPGAFSDPPPEYMARRITPFEAIAIRLSRPARDHRTVSELHEFDEVLAAAAAPWPQKIDEAARLERKYPRASSRGGAVMNIVNPFVAHAANRDLQFFLPNVAESLARTRASIGAVAVARWRDDHGGALPASLHDLVPSYVAALLIDPYSGQELKYTIVKDTGYKVYSVGRNRKDDGGSWEQTSDLQWARRGDPLDIGIAVTAPKLP